MKTRRLVIRIAAVLVLVVIGVVMGVIGRGHTIYLDNKSLDYEGQSYKAPYKITVTAGGEQVAKLYDKERGSATCMGGTFTVTLEIMQTKGGAEEVQQSFGFSLGAGFGAEVEFELGLGAGGADGELAAAV